MEKAFKWQSLEYKPIVCLIIIVFPQLSIVLTSPISLSTICSTTSSTIPSAGAITGLL